MFDKLSAPFSPEKVSWRIGSTTKDKTKGMALAYIDARDVMNRLDEVVGPASWQDRYEIHGGKTICYLSLCVAFQNGEAVWITKADAAGDSAVEAEKGAISDAFKRAAVKWGIGRYLYDIESPWVELEGDGKRITKKEYARLNAILGAKKEHKPKIDDKEPAIDETTLAGYMMALNQAETLEQLHGVWVQIFKNGHKTPELELAKDARKRELTEAQ